MALRFEVANQIYPLLPKMVDKKYRGWRRDLRNIDGLAVINLDAGGVGHFSRLDDGQALKSNEIYMRFRVRNNMLKFATNAFFFQEGYGKYYTGARYGQFRVNKKGDLLLVALYDKDLKKLGPPEK